ncbi:ASKHA domain-containing protein, partial [Planktomarina sp.]|nr:ASKHA domain-containing protein [Planktomarina sp.]
SGARIALVDTAQRAVIERFVRQIEKIETAIEPRFQEHFVNASAIPNSDDPFTTLKSVLPLPDVNFNTGGGDSASGGRRRRRR